MLFIAIIIAASSELSWEVSCPCGVTGSEKKALANESSVRRLLTTTDDIIFGNFAFDIVQTDTLKLKAAFNGECPRLEDRNSKGKV